MSYTKININNILSNLGFTALKAMQRDMLNHSQNRKNIILLSPTGSGKTLAFVLPLLKRIDVEIDAVQTIILSPTRELALQIEDVIKKAKTGFKVLTCYGGHPFSRERNSLKNPPKIIIGTPGRLLDHLKRETFDTQYVKQFVIDEYDKCLELGFTKEVQAILYRLPHIKYTTLTSATKIDALPDYLRLSKSKTLNYLDEQEDLNLQYYYIESTWEEKNNHLLKLLSHISQDASILFCNYKKDIEGLSQFLNNHSINHSTFYGDLEQSAREKALLKFRNGSVRLLLATDLAARGLDIPEIKNIVHYQIPQKEDAFIHRNGRTARMNKSGNVFLLIVKGKNIPEYVSPSIEKINLDELHYPSTKVNKPIQTICISAGKMHKISKVDVLGFLCKQGGLDNSAIGLIEIKERASFVAVSENQAKKAVKNCDGKRIKKVRVNVQTV